MFKWRAMPFFKGRLLCNCKKTKQNLEFFSRTTGPISTKLATVHPWVKGIQVCSNEEPFNPHKVVSFNQHYDNHMCISIFKKFSQVSIVAHGSPGVFLWFLWFLEGFILTYVLHVTAITDILSLIHFTPRLLLLQMIYIFFLFLLY